ncbi:hypothetical protein B0O99DRAFT_272824 [Bisporella sp. PMI_857]|nr:hypothetical protein B0O99DRAFT_272824 [Bisporella sp. PMI_857]
MLELKKVPYTQLKRFSIKSLHSIRDRSSTFYSHSNRQPTMSSLNLPGTITINPTTVNSLISAFADLSSDLSVLKSQFTDEPRLTRFLSTTNLTARTWLSIDESLYSLLRASIEWESRQHLNTMERDILSADQSEFDRLKRRYDELKADITTLRIQLEGIDGGYPYPQAVHYRVIGNQCVKGARKPAWAAQGEDSSSQPSRPSIFEMRSSPPTHSTPTAPPSSTEYRDLRSSPAQNLPISSPTARLSFPLPAAPSPASATSRPRPGTDRSPDPPIHIPTAPGAAQRIAGLVDESRGFSPQELYDGDHLRCPRDLMDKIRVLEAEVERQRKVIWGLRGEVEELKIKRGEDKETIARLREGQEEGKALMDDMLEVVRGRGGL